MADDLSKLAKPRGRDQEKRRAWAAASAPASARRPAAAKRANTRVRAGSSRTSKADRRRFSAASPSAASTIRSRRRPREVNVGDLEVFAAGANVDEKALRERGLVKGSCDRIKILGDGDLSKGVTVTAHSFSKRGAEKIAKAGGKAQLLAADAGRRGAGKSTAYVPSPASRTSARCRSCVSGSSSRSGCSRSTASGSS